MLKILGEIYSWFWYHTEVWITDKLKRRLYTYIMRDWIFNHGKAAAAQAYKSAVSAANIEKMFSGGVKKAGADKYANKAGTLGAQRFGQGEQEFPPYNPDATGTGASSPDGGSAAPGAPGQPPAGPR